MQHVLFSKHAKFLLAIIVSIMIMSCISVIHGKTLITKLPGFNESIPFRSYTGYLDTRDEAYLFYWFHESQRSPSTDPLVVWIQGGPGCSGFLGQSYENGYFLINPGGKTLRSNPYSWNREANVLYIEQPINTGFSYSTKSNVGVCNDTRSAEDMNFAFRDFLLQFPQFIGRDVYLAGESYAGIYIPVTTNRIIQGNQRGELPLINLVGVLIGNGMCNEDVLIETLPPNWLYHSIISNDQYERLVKECNNNYVNMTVGCRYLWNEAFSMMYDPLYAENSCPFPVDAKYALGNRFNKISNTIKFNKFNNRIKEERDAPCVTPVDLNAYFNIPEVQKALNVSPRGIPKHGWSCCAERCPYVQTVMNIMDYYKPILPTVRMIIYNGDSDLTTPSVGVEKSLKTLNLPLQSDFKGWNLDNGVNGGYTLSYSFGKGLTFTTIRGAGHMSPAQKPEATLHMLNRFISNKPL